MLDCQAELPHAWVAADDEFRRCTEFHLPGLRGDRSGMCWMFHATR
jgi:hypothetical protein